MSRSGRCAGQEGSQTPRLGERLTRVAWEMRATMITWTLPRAARTVALSAILTAGAGACEHTPSLEPPSPRVAPAASVESHKMEALLTAVQRESQAQGPTDPAREQLIAALFTAHREPGPRVAGTDGPATAVPPHMQHALARLLAPRRDSVAIVSTLQELVGRNTRTP